MEVAERLAERRLRWDDTAILIEPRAQLGDRRCAILGATKKALLGRLAERRREALDGEDAAELEQRHEGERIASTCAGDKATAPVSPAAGALTAGALDEVQDARAVALHRAANILAEEVPDALCVTVSRVEEGHPRLATDPAPHRS